MTKYNIINLTVHIIDKTFLFNQKSKLQITLFSIFFSKTFKKMIHLNFTRRYNNRDSVIYIEK